MRQYQRIGCLLALYYEHRLDTAPMSTFWQFSLFGLGFEFQSYFLSEIFKCRSHAASPQSAGNNAQEVSVCAKIQRICAKLCLFSDSRVNKIARAEKNRALSC